MPQAVFLGVELQYTRAKSRPEFILFMLYIKVPLIGNIYCINQDKQTINIVKYIILSKTSNVKVANACIKWCFLIIKPNNPNNEHHRVHESHND